MRKHPHRKRKYKYLTKKRLAELQNEGNYLAWVKLRNQYSEAALIRNGCLKVPLNWKAPKKNQK